jgi:hypothetical protein
MKEEVKYCEKCGEKLIFTQERTHSCFESEYDIDTGKPTPIYKFTWICPKRKGLFGGGHTKGTMIGHTPNFLLSQYHGDPL